MNEKDREWIAKVVRGANGTFPERIAAMATIEQARIADALERLIDRQAHPPVLIELVVDDRVIEEADLDAFRGGLLEELGKGPSIVAVPPDGISIRVHPLTMSSTHVATRDALQEELVHTRPAPRTSLNASEAVFGFASWLTVRGESLTVGATHDAAPVAELVARFLKAQGLEPVREGWSNRIVSMESGQLKRTPDDERGAPDPLRMPDPEVER